MVIKIEVDIAYLKSIGLSQKQISEIIKNAEPEHWTNKLPQGNNCFELLPFMITPEVRLKERVTIYCANQHDPTLSFFTEEDAEFIQNKCRLLVEMSNFSFAVNETWCPDWNNKDEKKYGIVLQNGQARVSENELFNLYVFGIVTKSRSLALEMLEEFKERVETYFNKPFNSVSEKIAIQDDYSLLGGVIGNNHSTDFNSDFIGSFAPRYESVSTRKKRKVLIPSDVPKIQELLLNNVPQKDIAEQFNYSQGTISRVKESLGFTIRKRSTPQD